VDCDTRFSGLTTVILLVAKTVFCQQKQFSFPGAAAFLTASLTKHDTAFYKIVKLVNEKCSTRKRKINYLEWTCAAGASV
jgi:hypothetical protein